MKAGLIKRATGGHLTQVALRLFAQQGYEGTTVAAITAAAGLGKGTFFNYFRTKEELLLQWLQSHYDWTGTQVPKLLQLPGPIAPRLLPLLAAMSQRMELTRPLGRALLQVYLAGAAQTGGAQIGASQVGGTQTGASQVGGSQTGGTQNGGFTPHAASLEMVLYPLLLAAHNRGDFVRHISPGLLAIMAAQTFYGSLWTWSTGTGAEPFTSALTRSCDLFSYGALRTRGLTAEL